MIRKGTVRPPLPKILTDSNGATTLHGGDGGGGEASFSPFEVGKTSETSFRAQCLN